MHDDWIRFRLLRIDPTRFEELCHALLKAEGHRNVRHLGASGGDGGVDVLSQGPDGRRWVTQCKRYKSLSPGVLEKEVRRLIERPLDPPPEVFHLAATCDVSRTCEEALERAVQEAPFPLEIASFWAITELVGFLRDDYPELCAKFIGNLEEAASEPASADSSWIQLKKEKLAFLRQEEAISADPGLKFQLKHQIQELEREISEASVHSAGPSTSDRSALQLKREKLAFFREQEVIASDPSLKFQLRRQIEELKEELRDVV